MEIMRRKFSRFSEEPPSQYWREFMKLRASWRLVGGEVLEHLGEGAARA